MERDAIDGLEIPEGHYWGAQTERSRRELFAGASSETAPQEVIRAFGILKKAAARANFDLLPEQMNEEKCAAIFSAADEIIRGRLADEFPLAVWQADAGGKINVNVNEVIARRGSEMADEPLLCSGDDGLSQPPDGMADEPLLSPEDVNLSQPPDGAFAAAVHIAAALAVEEQLLPALEALLDILTRREDATPWRGSIERGRDALRGSLPGLYSLTLGGAGAPEGYAAAVAAEAAKQTGKAFVPADGAGSEAGSLDALLAAHGAMRSLARKLVDTLCAAPPSEKAAVSCERLEIAAAQVMGNDAVLEFVAGEWEGDYENRFLPLCAYNFLQSARLLSESIASFVSECGDEEG